MKILFLLLLCSLPMTSFADEIYGSSEGSLVTRYDFTYTTTDIDGVTPIELSGAIFVDSRSKSTERYGYILLNHYTVTANSQCATNVSASVTSLLTLEHWLVDSGYIIIESDGRGLGKTKDLAQDYLIGRCSARNNIDAYIAGRKLIEKEGYTARNVVCNVGYSQGGSSAMWVSRLVAEGYRSDEIPRIDYAFIGGGPYDTYGMYKHMLQTGVSLYPCVLPLIFNGLIAEGECGITQDDVFLPEFKAVLPELFDSKKYTSDQVNTYIYNKFGGDSKNGIQLSKLVTPECLDLNSEVMQRIIPRLQANSLVYNDWAPTNTVKMDMLHTTDDEIVFYLNWENMKQHLDDVGYTNYTTDIFSGEGHVDAGQTFAFHTKSKLVQITSETASATYNPVKLK